MSENKLTVLDGAKARLIVVKNPFQPWNGRIVKDIVAGQKLKDVIENEYQNIGCDIYISINGKTIPINDYEILGGEIITLSPIVGKGGGAKKILGLVAMVALAVVSMGVGNLAAVGGGSFFTLGGATWGATSYALAAAVMFIGGSLISKAFTSQPKIASSQYNEYDNDPTYSWGDVQTMEGQNNSIQMTFGKVQSAGQTIGKFVQTKNNQEYFNWLIACGEGPLEFSNILINDNPVSYYAGMTLETRSGENNQDVIPYFNDTYFTKSLGYQLYSNWRTDRAQGNGTQGLIIKIECPNGLFYSNDDGSLGVAWVDFVAEYCEVGTENWKPFFTNTATSYYFEGPNFMSLNGSSVDGDYTITIHRKDFNYYDINIKYPDNRNFNAEIYRNDTEYIGNFIINGREISGIYYDDEKGIGGTETYTARVWHSTYLVAQRISGAQSSAIRQEFRIDNISAGEYDVRVRVTGRSHSETSSRASTRCYWNSLTSIVYDDFEYPNTALIGLRALATDQISGTPTIKFIKERKYVWVFNTETNQYEQKPSNNPAWACYDMLHLASRLYNINTGGYDMEVRGVPAHSMIFEHFNEWAKFCEEKKYYVNLEINSAGEMLNVINENIASIGHGVIVRFGTRYGAIWYCKKQPVQMFGMGNIVSGTFKEDFLQTSDRANCVEISYIDANHDYNKETITMYSDSYDGDAKENATQVTFNGITSYEQAYREGMYQMFCNKWQLRTVSFEANVDAIACTIGDVILVAHDVPQWSQSGRIYSVDVENGLFRLPVELTDTQSNLRMMYRTINDKLYTIPITVIENENGWCTVQGNVADNNDCPQKGDLFDVGLVITGSKPFVVTNITRAQDFTRNISCIEYIEQIYDEDYTIPPINYTTATINRAKNVTGLNASQVSYTNGFGVKQSRMFVSWNVPDNGGAFNILISKDGKSFKPIANKYKGDNIDFDVDAETDYYVKVITVLGISQSNGVVVGPIYRGVDALPPNITALDTEIIADGTRRYFWEFKYPNPNDIAGFRMKYIQGNKPNWERGNVVQEGLITVQPYETTTIMQGVHTIMIKAVDNAGQESASFASCIVDFGDPLEDNVLWKMNFLQNTDAFYWSGKQGTFWNSEKSYHWSHYNTNGVLRDDGFIHAMQSSSFWENARYTHFVSPETSYWEQMYKDFYLEASFVAPASGYFFLEYDIEGTYNISYKIIDKDNMYKPYSTKVYINAGDVISVKFESISGNNDTVVKKLFGVIDVPDRVEHFENIQISRNGTELPIKTQHYYTTAVSIDSISINDDRDIGYFVERTLNNPCVIKIYRVYINNGNIVKEYIDCNADITWQGFEKELNV